MKIKLLVSQKNPFCKTMLVNILSSLPLPNGKFGTYQHHTVFEGYNDTDMKLTLLTKF